MKMRVDDRMSRGSVAVEGLDWWLQDAARVEALWLRGRLGTGGGIAFIVRACSVGVTTHNHTVG